jgi:hypothetical protein
MLDMVLTDVTRKFLFFREFVRAQTIEPLRLRFTSPIKKIYSFNPPGGFSSRRSKFIKFSITASPLLSLIYLFI